MKCFFIFIFACHRESGLKASLWPDTGANFDPNLSIVYQGELTPNGSTIDIETAPAGVDSTLHMRFVITNLTDQDTSFGETGWINNERFIVSPTPPSTLAARESATINVYTNPQDLSAENWSSTELAAPEADLKLTIVAHTPPPLRMGLIGDGGFQLWSDDYGETFSEITMADSPLEAAKTITWGDNRFLYGGAKSGATNAEGIWRHSTDGQTWVESEAEIAFSATECVYGLGRFACVREDVLSSSTDGITIEHQPPLHEYKMNAIVALPDRFVAVGRGGRQAVSRDGQTWSFETESNEPDPYHDLASNGDILVAVGGVNRYHVSVSTNQGESWVDVPFGNCIGNSLESIVYLNGIFIAQGASDCHHNMNWSENGLTWNPITALHPFDRHHLLGVHNDWVFGWTEDNFGHRHVTRSRDGSQWENVYQLPQNTVLRDMGSESWVLQ